MRDGLSISSLPNPFDRYKLDIKLGSGIFGEVYKAIDNQAAGKAVAVKVQEYIEEREDQIQDEYRILRDFTQHPNLIDFYGVFCDDAEEIDKIWFVIELCEYGSVLDVVKKLKEADKKMSEEHIAFILKYTIRGLTYLHENKIMHRNIRCNNILINKDGEIKLTDFGLSCTVEGTLGKSITNIGSPSWMAPEVVTGGAEGYDNRADVWALGIATIEMVDGVAPFQDMHPTRALFQIVRNPPPSLLKPSMSSNDINDFITECLEKNPEHRPFMMELAEHPFIQSVPENDFYLFTELKMTAASVKDKEIPEKIPERIIKNGLLVTEGKKKPEIMQVEDLAALEHLTEKHLMLEVLRKLKKGSFTSFVGDILLILNPNTNDNIYNLMYHKKYECKSRSDNEPHIFAVADSAFQDALHHNEPQHIIFTGESKSGKTTNMFHALSHLTYLGAMKNNLAHRIKKAAKVISESISAATPINANSTRAIFQIQVTYGTSGKLSGAIFWLYQLEKWRVSSTDMTHANFNLLYYFYDTMEADGKLNDLYLERNRKHRYLRTTEEPMKEPQGVRENPQENVSRYKEFIDNLKELDWEEEDIKFLETILAAILILGNVRFRDSKSGTAEIENVEEAKKVAKLLSLDEAKFLWSLLNYCLIEKGTCVKKTHTTDDARDARDVLAGALYKRLVDWMINIINAKLSFMRSVFGDKFCVSLLDMFGFECFHRNRLEQLIVNTTNEQMQFLYNQKIFVWEMQEEQAEGINLEPFRFYDNKNSVDQLMSRPRGLFCVLDEASRSGRGQGFILTTIKSLYRGPYIKLAGSHEFCIAHYTGKVNYDAREMSDKNRDFLPPEMIETMRASTNLTLHHFFKNKLTKSGNLTVSSSQSHAEGTKLEKEKQNVKTRKYNTGSKGMYSQVHKMRTASAIYRATSLEILKQLAVGPGSGGAHYVRCIRPCLDDKPLGFEAEVVRQQVRALGILDTARARQKGFSCRIPFAEFIRRYRFLAFDFDENVEVTKDNCRLLLIRLKMEGWELGDNKVFLKYYNEEFLSRLYETQVKKIVKVQSMMRAFLVKRKANKEKIKKERLHQLKKQQSVTLSITEDDAAIMIQKAYRGHVVRKAYAPLISKTTYEINEETAAFLKRFAMKWKSRSMFQVLLQYRAVRYQDLVHFSQQVHIYNQAALESFVNTSTSVLLDRVDPKVKAADYLGSGPPTVWKLPFRIDQIQYYDTSYMCDPSVKCTDTFENPYDSDLEQWDEPLKHRITWTQADDLSEKMGLNKQTLVSIPYIRDPTQSIPQLPEIEEPEITPELPPVEQREVKVEHDSQEESQKQEPPQTYYQPPEPWCAAESDDNVLENSAPKSALRKGGHTRSLYGVNQIDMPNPISELQALAKSTSDLNNDDDDPPYNFQAMLKKTPKNRASMKRYGEMDDIHEYKERQSGPTRHIVMPQTSNPNISSSQPHHQNNPNISSSQPRPQNNPNISSSQPRPQNNPNISSHQPHPQKKITRKSSRDFIMGVARKDSKINLLPTIENKNDSNIMEMAPGITFEGTATDL